MSSSSAATSDLVRVIVRTSTTTDDETIVVIEQSMTHNEVLQKVSNHVGYQVKQLYLLVYHDGHLALKSAVCSTKTLQNYDIIYAASKESKLLDKQKTKMEDNKKKKKRPLLPPAEIEMTKVYKKQRQHEGKAAASSSPSPVPVKDVNNRVITPIPRRKTSRKTALPKRKPKSASASCITNGLKHKIGTQVKTARPKSKPKSSSAGCITNGFKYKIGIQVLGYFPGHGDGWYDGKIISYDPDYRLYKLRYTDGDEQEYEYNSPILEIMVQLGKVGNASKMSEMTKQQLKQQLIKLIEEQQKAASEPPPKPVYAVGTRVRKHWDEFNKSYGGQIISISNETLMYTIQYDWNCDDDRNIEECFFNDPEIDKLVHNAVLFETTAAAAAAAASVMEATTTSVGMSTKKEEDKEVSDTDNNKDKSSINCNVPLTDEQRFRLQGSEFDIAKFELYLYNVAKMKASKIGPMMVQVAKLQQGGGIRYAGWNKHSIDNDDNDNGDNNNNNVILHHDPIIDLSVNISQIRQHAVQHEKKYGYYHNKKGLLQNILQTIEDYQIYYFHNKLSLSSTHTDIEHHRRLQEEALKQKMWLQFLEKPITTEQRLQLKKYNFDLEEFMSYLKNEEGLMKGSIDGLKRRMKKLRNGEPITSSLWPDGVVFVARQPIKDLGVDFQELANDAKNHQSQYSNGRRDVAQLRYDFSKLQKYQKYFYYHRVLAKMSSSSASYCGKEEESDVKISASAASKEESDSDGCWV